MHPAIFSDELEVKLSPIQILSVDEKCRLLMKSKEQLEYLLTNQASVPIHIISIFGDRFSGKSSLMNLMINYLKNDCKGLKGKIEHFFEISKRKRVVDNSVFVYPEIFIKDSPHGQYGIMLMDTEGLFDGKYKNLASLQFKVCKTLSSLMILNAMGEKLPTEALQNAMEHSESKNSVSIDTDFVLLIRDRAGNRFEELPFSSSSLATMKDFTSNDGAVINGICKKFGNVKCFTLTKPSKAVHTNTFKGDIKNLPSQFVKAVNNLFANITQRGDNRLLTGNQLWTFFRTIIASDSVTWKPFIRNYVEIIGPDLQQNSRAEVSSQDSAEITGPNLQQNSRAEVSSQESSSGSKSKKGRSKKSKRKVDSAPVQPAFDNSQSGVVEPEINRTTITDTRSNMNRSKRGSGKCVNAYQAASVSKAEDNVSKNENVVNSNPSEHDIFLEKIKKNLAKAFYTNLKKKCFDSIQSMSDSEMPRLMGEQDGLVSYRDLCLDLIEKIYQFSTDHSFSDMYEEHKEHLKMKIIEETVENAMQLAVKNYKDAITRVGTIALDNIDSHLITQFIEFWTEEHVHDLKLKFARAFYDVRKTHCLYSIIDKLKIQQPSFITLGAYRKLCSDLVENDFQSSENYDFPEIYDVHKRELEMEVKERTVEDALKIARRQYATDMCDIDEWTFDYKNTEVVENLTTMFRGFWGEMHIYSLESNLKTEFYNIMKRQCELRLRRQLEYVNYESYDIIILSNMAQEVITHYFPTNSWNDPNNTVPRFELQNNLKREVSEKTMRILKSKYENTMRTYVEDNVLPVLEGNFVKFSDEIKTECVVHMRKINPSYVSQLERELNEIEFQYKTKNNEKWDNAKSIGAGVAVAAGAIGAGLYMMSGGNKKKPEVNNQSVLHIQSPEQENSGFWGNLLAAGAGALAAYAADLEKKNPPNINRR